jgi:hypothetical protein
MAHRISIKASFGSPEILIFEPAFNIAAQLSFESIAVSPALIRVVILLR